MGDCHAVCYLHLRGGGRLMEKKKGEPLNWNGGRGEKVTQEAGGKST